MAQSFTTVFIALALLAAGGLTGCDRQQPKPPDNYIRLVDWVEEAEFDSAVDLAAKQFVPTYAGTVLLNETFDLFDSNRYMIQPSNLLELMKEKGSSPDSLPALDPTIEGEGSGRHLSLKGDEAFLALLPMKPGLPHQIDVFVKCEDPEDVNVALLELGHRLAPADLTHRTKMDNAFALAGSHIHTLNPGNKLDDNGFQQFTCGLSEPADKTRSLLLTVAASGKGVAVDNLTVTLPTPFMEQLKFRAAEFTHPHVRRVNAGKDFRESIVFMAPGEVRFKLRLPLHDPMMNVAAFVPDHATSPAVEAVATVRGEKDEFTLTLNLGSEGESPPAQWQGSEIPLSPLAGQEVEVILAARPKSTHVDGEHDGDEDATPDNSPVGIAFGNPVIIGGKADRNVPPDVIVISLDTARADRMSVYGATLPTTPYLEELAESSVVFDAAIAPAAYTLPSHASMLTGQLPDRIATRTKILGVHPQSAPLLAREFRAKGYRTLAYTGGGYMHPEFGFDAGFERFVTEDVGMAVRRIISGFEHESINVLNELSSILKKESPIPRFILLHTFAAHQYRVPAPELLAVGADPEAVPELTQLNERPEPVMKLLEELNCIGEENADRLTVLYDGALRVADAFVRRIADDLKAGGRFDDTYLFILSDHGEELYERGGFGHGHQIYEELIRVPFMARGPGFVPGRNDTVISIADLAPTLRELCGVTSLSDGIDGRSLVPLLQGKTLPNMPTIARLCRGMNKITYAFRSDKYKLFVEQGKEDDGMKLYNLVDDPAEKNDISPEMEKVCKELRKLLNMRIKEMENQATGAKPVLSKELMENLRKLGYVDFDEGH